MSQRDTAALVADYLRSGGLVAKCPAYAVTDSKDIRFREWEPGKHRPTRPRGQRPTNAASERDDHYLRFPENSEYAIPSSYRGVAVRHYVPPAYGELEDRDDLEREMILRELRDLGREADDE